MRSADRVRKWAAWCGLAAIVALATWLRLHAIGDKSFWTDEGVSAAFTRLDWYNFGRILWRREGNMTLYYLLLRGWSLMGDSVAMIRGMSVVWSVATVVAVFALGRRLFGSLTGLTAALLLAVNAYSVRYAQEARSYSMVAYLVTVATLVFVRAIETGRRRDWTWYVAASVLGVYAHFFAVLVLVAHGVIVWWVMPSKKGEFISAAKKIALWTLPVWVFIATTGAGPIGWIPRPSPQYLAVVFRHYAGNGGWLLAALYLACALLFAWTREKDWKTWLLLAWFVAPVCVSLTVSLVRPLFLARYMIVCLPALVLMVATGITSLRRWWIAVPLLGMICWFAVGGVRSYYANDFDISREDCRGAAEYVLAHAQLGDVIAFHKAQNRFAFTYYAEHMSGVRPTIMYPGGDQPTWRDFFGKATPQVLDSLAKANGRVWLVVSENMGPQGEDAAAQRIKSAVAGTHPLVRVKDVAFLKVYLYEKK
jgi:mannosyltransferase